MRTCHNSLMPEMTTRLFWTAIEQDAWNESLQPWERRAGDEVPADHFVVSVTVDVVGRGVVARSWWAVPSTSGFAEAVGERRTALLATTGVASATDHRWDTRTQNPSRKTSL